MAGTIFDGNFQTSLPDTSGPLNLMAAALAARQKALDPTSIFSGLKNAGKVFTDMESELKKSNTALLQRHLDAMTPSQIEQMIANGVDPVKEAYLAGVPINGADTELNKAWDKDITDAGTQLANRWVATVLPTLSHKARMELMTSNDPTIWDKYGLSPIARISPDVQQQIKTALQNAATTEAILNSNEDIEELTASGELPSSRTIRRIPDSVADNVDYNNQVLQGVWSNLMEVAKAFKTDSDLLNSDRDRTGAGAVKPSPFGYNGKAVQTQHEADFVNRVVSRFHQLKNDSNTGETDDELINAAMEMVYSDVGDGGSKWDIPIEKYHALKPIIAKQITSPSYQPEAQALQAASSESVYHSRTYNPDEMEDILALYQRWDREKNPKAPKLKQDIDASYDQHWRNFLFPEIEKLITNGKISEEQYRAKVTAWQKELIENPETRKGMSPESFKLFQESFQRVTDSAAKYLDNFMKYRDQQKMLFIERNRKALEEYPSVYRDILKSGGKYIPEDVMTLMKSGNLKTVAQKLLNHADYTAWNSADPITKAAIIWEALNTYQKITNDERTALEIVKDTEDLQHINNEDFSHYLRVAIDADLANTYKNSKTDALGEVNQKQQKERTEGK